MKKDAEADKSGFLKANVRKGRLTYFQNDFLCTGQLDWAKWVQAYMPEFGQIFDFGENSSYDQKRRGYPVFVALEDPA